MTRLFLVLVSVTLLASVMLAGPALAADEDTQASVYLVFDPETGDFITVDDPSVTAQHAAAQKQEEIDSGTAAADASAPADTGGEASGQPPMALAIGAAVAVLVLGGFIWMRRGKQDTA